MKYETYYQNIENGDTFVCIKGNHYDGHDFIDKALEKGASLVIGQQNLKMKGYKKVRDSKEYLTKKISKLNKNLTKNMTLIGITGTKGKTTTAFIIYQMLKNLNVKVAYIGTLGLYYNNCYEELLNTSPDILALNKIFQKLKDNNITHVIMEVSSIALCEKRLDGLTFNIACFTNLAQDHLDYHENMENYLKAKLKILKHLKGTIILNDDDKASINFKNKAKCYDTIGQNGNIRIENYHLYETYSTVSFECDYNHYTVSIPFIGKHNIYNYLMAISVLKHLNYDFFDIINTTNFLLPIKGRNELVKSSKGFVIIDYAHNPSSVKETLETFNELKKSRIITIIGCGGNRDKTKRPIMGDIVTKMSDYVIFTSDNPRDEEAKDIIKDMTSNLTTKNYMVIENRESAIKKGVKLLKHNDYLLILGKGHENYQIRKNVKYHFDDKEIALKYLN